MNKPTQKIDYLFLIFLIILSGIYFYWTWNHELAGLGGDNAVYLLTAKHFSPWAPASSVAEYFAGHSQYPPLYPFILSILGGGQSIFAAHLVTTACLLLALVALRTWLLAEGLHNTTANLTIVLIALLPGTLKIAMFILSENLYLFLSLLALALTSLSEKKRRHYLLVMAAVLVAGATLTRTAGLSLAAAFCLYLIIRRPVTGLFCGFLALAPVVLHTFIKSITGGESNNYWDSLLSYYKHNALEKLLEQIQRESLFLWNGWLANFEAGFSRIIIGMLLILCCLALVIRIYQRKLDAIYLLFYLIMIFLWPFPAEAKRLIYIVLPIMVGQSLLLLNQVPSLAVGKIDVKPASLVVLTIIIVSLPGTLHMAQRFLQPLPPELEPYRRTKFLYHSKPNVAISNVNNARVLIEDIKGLKSLLPDHSVIYGIKPSLIALYSGKMSKTLPSSLLESAPLGFIQDKPDSSYIYMIGITSPSFREPYYPLNSIINDIDILQVAKAYDGEDAPTIAILARPKQRSLQGEW